MEMSLLFILAVVFLAFVFDFTNGFHDAANSIATIVATGILKPWQAVIWAAFFNFIAFLFFKLTIATTIGTGLIHPAIVSPYVIFSALTSAITWNMITWYYGLPSSSSHALIGGLAGAALAKGGLHALMPSGFIKVIAAIILSPLLGLSLAFVLTLCVTRLTRRNSHKSNERWFKYIQLLSSAMLSLTHGGNDAQKTMGVITVLLYSGALLTGPFQVPFWVVLSSYLVIALGTLVGGWRIVDTMGHKIADLNRLRGSCAESSAALIIYGATDFGVPISTTHTITGAIAGVGLAGNGHIQWVIMRTIFVAWLLTMPATAIIASTIMALVALI